MRAPLHLLHNPLTAWVVLVVLLLLTACAWYLADRYVERRAAERFQFEVEDARQRIAERMRNYEQVLRGGAALFAALDGRVDRAQWREYVAGLEIQTYFPGIQGVGFARMIPAAELARHERALRAEGFPDYAVRPAGARDPYSAIVFLEPWDWRNQRAFGFDMYSEPVRRAAMEQARDTGAPAVSGRVTLVQETDRDVQYGFLMYLPVYRPGLPLGTVEQRRAALIGFVYSPFRIGDLMRGILGSDAPGVGFDLYDTRESAANLLYASDPAAPHRRHLHTVIHLPGRAWAIVFHSRPALDAELASREPAFIALGGLLVDGLLFFIIWSQAGEQRRVQSKAERMTAELRASTRRLQLAQTAGQLGTWDLDLRDHSLIWDDRMCRIYGVDPGAFDGTFAAWRRRVHPEDLARAEAQLQRALDRGEFQLVFRIVRDDGETRVVESHGVVLRDAAGQAERMIGINRDITERTLVEERLRLAASVFHHAHEGIVITDADERIIEANPTFCEITGYARTELIGQTPRILKSRRQEPEFYAAMWRKVASEGFWRGELWNRRKNGEIYAELLTISAVHGPEGRVCNYVGVLTDITMVKDHQARLERMAHYDGLTQLPNRVLLADRLRQAMAHARRHDLLLAVCYVDLDGFKPVNDLHGHQAGDTVLVQVAARLTAALRESDTTARLGGDEFVLLLGELHDMSECELAMNRLLKAIAEPYRLDGGGSVNISASIGVTLYPLDEADADTLLRHADQAMYTAKQSGRNRFHLFDPEGERRAYSRNEALARIEAGFEQEEFCLFYQPKVDMRRGEVVGAEALIRWQHPALGLLPPGEFLPVVEHTPVATQLGDWVLRSALAQLRAWNGDGLRLAVSVNISGRHLEQPGFVQRLEELLRAHPEVAPGQLELEVLETAALNDVALVSSVIGRCRELGIGFAIDDFGTGYSSLSYLRQLPADTLKIDQSFVRDVLDDPEDRAIIEGIISLARVFGRRLVAEGVETEAHAELLLRLGCDVGQGYGIARPMPAAQLPAWVEGYRPFARAAGGF